MTFKIKLHSKSNISKVVYSSSNNKVTKVSNKGTITAVNKGKATINMKITLKNKKTKNIKVKVTV